jgi:hypothetical protein
MKKTVVLGLAVLFVGSLAGRALAAEPVKSGYTPEMQKVVDELKRFTDEKARVAKDIATFDELDFVVFTNQQWTRLHESHAKDVIVNWPDGHHTNGIDKHIEDLKALFVYAPDTAIRQHPVKFGSGDFTAVTGVMTGTFTKPMPIGDGKFIQPTGKAFSIPMCTVGHWKNGVMVEEFLYWDNLTYLKQIGVMQ